MGRYHQKKENRSGGLIVLLTISLIILTALGWFYFSEETANGIAIPEKKTLALPPLSNGADSISTLAQTDMDVTTTESDIETTNDNTGQNEVMVLPSIDNSDQFFREELLKLTPGLAPWLNTDQLIRKYLVIVNDFSQGSRLEKHMRFIKPEIPFSVEQGRDGLFIAASSYQRYDRLAAAINLLDVPAALAVYKKIRPLLMQVFNEFSYPESYSLEDIFTKAAAEIISAPTIDQRIAVVRPSVNYKFADPQLEALNPVHKQMIRMGPENTRIIQNKVRRLVEGLVNLDR